MTAQIIAVYGATGFTGRLVCAELARRGLEFVMAGRNRAALGDQAELLKEQFGLEPQVRVAEHDDVTALDAMLFGVHVLINCAGPFSELGAPVAEAAIRNRVHYLDTTGEQGYMRWLLAHCDGPAAEQKIALLSACAFEYATGDFAAELALRQGAVHIVVCYAVRNMGMTHGTKKSVVRSLADKGVTFVDGHLVERSPAYRIFDVPFPNGSTKKAPWFPGGEPLQVPRRGGVTWVESCIVTGEATAHLLATFSGLIPAVMKLVKPVADRVVEMSNADPHKGVEGVPDFLVIAFDPKTGRAFATLAGVDAYRTTARIAVEAATRLTQREPKKVGFTSAAALFDAESFLEAVGLQIVLPAER
ncbi:MAG: saccharopine dehydrogenase NADP-binding domain-containing protein [Bradymonadaceae bacterium]|nr:saccharopine dehydrogenase NADP-binding domain-containing protein [Lujinxingiaceae bacterium]